MAKATGITLTAVAIGMGNEFVQGYGINLRMGIAGLGAAAFLTGVEKLNETAGVGLSVLVFITVLLTPFKGKAPAQEVLSLIGLPKGSNIVGATGPIGGVPNPAVPTRPGPTPGITFA